MRRWAPKADRIPLYRSWQLGVRLTQAETLTRAFDGGTEQFKRDSLYKRGRGFDEETVQKVKRKLD